MFAVEYISVTHVARVFSGDGQSVLLVLDHFQQHSAICSILPPFILRAPYEINYFGPKVKSLNAIEPLFLALS